MKDNVKRAFLKLAARDDRATNPISRYFTSPSAYGGTLAGLGAIGGGVAGAAAKKGKAGVIGGVLGGAAIYGGVGAGGMALQRWIGARGLKGRMNKAKNEGKPATEYLTDTEKSMFKSKVDSLKKK